MNNEKRLIEDVKKPIVDREIQIEIMKFFLKTSIPRILKAIEGRQE